MRSWDDSLQLILTICATMWFSGCFVADRKTLQQTVKTTQHFTGSRPQKTSSASGRCVRHHQGPVTSKPQSLPFSNQAGRAGLSVLAPKAQEQFLSTYQCDKEGFSCLQERVSAANSAFHLHMLKLALIAHLAPPLYLLFSITTVTYLTTGTSLLLSLHLSCTCCPAPSICNDCKFRMPLRDAPAHYVPHLNIHYTCKFSTAHLDLPHVLHI